MTNSIKIFVRIAVAILAATIFNSGAFAEQTKPNILFFFVDDMGWQDTSVAFHTEPTALNNDYRTPNMEQLASEGVLFTNAYATSICSPTRVSLMTGMNAARHKVTCWTLRKDKSPEQNHPTLQSPNWNVNGLQPIGSNIDRSFESVTLPELLRKNGYRTIHAGKAHFGAQGTPGADPTNLGFDVNIAGSYMGGPGSYHGDKNFSAQWRGGSKIWDVPGLEKYHGEKINLTEAITREAISAIEQSINDKQPFYLYISHYAVHAPFEPDRRFLPNYQDKDWNNHKKVYASMLESMDRSLGDLMATLDRLEIADNTIVVFMSDNGSPRNNPRNLPLRGHKISGYEGGNRVPLIVKWPGVSPTNKRTDSPIIIEDIFPTFLEMTGIDVPENDGVSFVDVIKNPSLDHSERPLFWHYPNLYDMPPYSSVRQGDWKLIYWYATKKTELFNLKDGIGESVDLADSYPKETKRLKQLLSQHLESCEAQKPIFKSDVPD